MPAPKHLRIYKALAVVLVLAAFIVYSRWFGKHSKPACNRPT